MANNSIVYSTSAALLFTEQELGGPCTEQESFPSFGNTGSTVIAKGNGDRVGLLILNMSGNGAYLGINQTVSSTSGIPLPALGGFFSCNVRDDFTLPSREWSIIGVGGGQVYVLEIIRFTSLGNDQ